jgi:hypothetical protein
MPFRKISMSWRSAGSVPTGLTMPSLASGFLPISALLLIWWWQDQFLPQSPSGGTGLRFETLEDDGEYPDTMPQAIKLIDAEGSFMRLQADHPERQGRG